MAMDMETRGATVVVVDADEPQCTLDGSVDFRGLPAAKSTTGGWLAGVLLLVNQGLATLAFFGVNVNLVLFLTRVIGQSNEEAANNVSKWTGTVYLFSLLGALLSDSYWGRYKTCAIFQSIFLMGLALLSASAQLYLIRPGGCGTDSGGCTEHSPMELGIFYVALYMVALGNGGYQPNVATFGADQFDGDDPKEERSKVAFFSYFYLALNLGSLFSNTLLSYLEDKGAWALGFWASTVSAAVALALFLAGTRRYRHFRPCGNPLSRVCQVAVAAARKWRHRAPPAGDGLFEGDAPKGFSDVSAGKKLLHTNGYGFLDRAACIDEHDLAVVTANAASSCRRRDPWRLCTVTQVEELKCVLRLLPIWLCTIIYSVVFTQMASLFVVQGAAMRRSLGPFIIPAASMSTFDIFTVAATIFVYNRLLHPLICRLTGTARGLTELHRMGMGLALAAMAMVAAGTVELFRLRRLAEDGGGLHIMWQVPQYMLIGASEVFMYVAQLEFFNGQVPDGLKSFASALYMLSMSLGNYMSDVIVSAVSVATAVGGSPGWIPADLDRGHLDRFYFLLAVMTAADLVVYVACAKAYKGIRVEGKFVA